MLTSLYPQYFVEDKRILENVYPLSKLFKFLVRESGYMHIQATKPDTVGKIHHQKNQFYLFLNPVLNYM